MKKFELSDGRKSSILYVCVSKIDFEVFLDFSVQPCSHRVKNQFEINNKEYVVELEYIPKPRSFPPLIFHDCLDNQRHQFTPRPTQAQEDKDYEVKNCHPK